MLLLAHPHLVRAAVAYNVVVLVAFLAAYMCIDFGTHFACAAAPTASCKVYFALMIHTSIGSNDVVPRTDFARRLVAAHALLSWMQVLVVFLRR